VILAKTLKTMLQKVPDDAKIYAYEGESTGLGVCMPDGTFEWITAYDSDTEDVQSEFGL
jgi:hypothetical protein